MKLFYRHLHLFENYSKIARYNVIDFSQSKQVREQDIALFVMKNKNDKIIYRFIIADTDINALFSFFEDGKYSEYELVYILRSNQIKEIINGKENYSIPTEAKDDIKETYKKLLNKDLTGMDDFYINRRLIAAEYELDDDKRKLHIHEYELIIKKIKEMIYYYKECDFTKRLAVVSCEAYLKQMGKIYYYYLINPIENFNAEKSYEYINKITFNRLDDKQKEDIKNYYDNLDKVYEYHFTKIGEKIDEAGNLIVEFRNRVENI